MRLDRLAHHRVVLGEGDPHPLGVGLPPTGRTLNVGEQKDNIGVPFAPYLYTVSTMHCMERVAGVGRRRAGHGMGQPAGHVDADRCGFSEVAVREIESDPINYYHVARK